MNYKGFVCSPIAVLGESFNSVLDSWRKMCIFCCFLRGKALSFLPLFEFTFPGLFFILTKKIYKSTQLFCVQGEQQFFIIYFINLSGSVFCPFLLLLLLFVSLCTLYPVSGFPPKRQSILLLFALIRLFLFVQFFKNEFSFKCFCFLLLFIFRFLYYLCVR